MEICGKQDDVNAVWRRLQKLEYFNTVDCFQSYSGYLKNTYVIKCLGYCNRYVICLYEQDIVDCFTGTQATCNIIFYSFDILDRMEIEISEDHSVKHQYYDFYNILNYKYTKDRWDKFVWRCLSSEYYKTEEEVERNFKEYFDESFDDEGRIDTDKWIMIKFSLYEDLSNTE